MPVIEGLVGDPWERTLPACPSVSDVEPVPLRGTLPCQLPKDFRVSSTQIRVHRCSSVVSLGEGSFAQPCAYS